MGADFDFSLDENGKPQFLFIDKGKKKLNVGNKLSDFNIEKQIGKGNFATVYLVKSKITNKVYAMKEIKAERYSNESQRKEVQKEIKLLENLDHPNIITYFSSFSENGNFYIITEYLNGGSLQDILKLSKENGKCISEEKLWDVLVQVLSGLCYLHYKKNIIHRDIKPDNILFDKDGNIKITDFGISAVNRDDADEIIKCHDTCIGPMQFMSPEMAQKEKYDFKSDIYMLGLTFFNLMSGELPQKNIIQNNNVYVALNQNAKLPDYYSRNLKDFVRKLLNVDPKERPSSKEAFPLAISFYTVKYMKFTSILATLRCFLAIPTLGSYFQSEKINELIRNDRTKEYAITKTLRDAFNSINSNNFNYDEAGISCLKFRILFYIKEEKLRKKPEIGIATFIEDICNNCHKEISKYKGYRYDKKPGCNTINEEEIKYKEEIIDESEEVEVLDSACQKFQEKCRSQLSNLLYFILKNSYQCVECNNIIKTTTVIHCAYELFPERAAIRLGKKRVNINDCFLHASLTRIYEGQQILCKFCDKTQQKYKITKIFYTFPKNIILVLNYSNETNFELQIDEYIDITKYVERKDICKPKYKLIGAIFTEQLEGEPKKYVSYTREEDGQWKYCNGKYISNSDLNELKNHEHIEALFYASE